MIGPIKRGEMNEIMFSHKKERKIYEIYKSIYKEITNYPNFAPYVIIE